MNLPLEHRHPENGMKSKQNMGKWEVSKNLREVKRWIFLLSQDDVRAKGQFCHLEDTVIQDRNQVLPNNSLFSSN